MGTLFLVIKCFDKTIKCSVKNYQRSVKNHQMLYQLFNGFSFTRIINCFVINYEWSNNIKSLINPLLNA